MYIIGVPFFGRCAELDGKAWVDVTVGTDYLPSSHEWTGTYDEAQRPLPSATVIHLWKMISILRITIYKFVLCKLYVKELKYIVVLAKLCMLCKTITHVTKLKAYV